VLIGGTGFDGLNCNNNAVKLAGSPCTITACTPTQLTCVAGAAPHTASNMTSIEYDAMMVVNGRPGAAGARSKTYSSNTAAAYELLNEAGAFPQFQDVLIGGMHSNMNYDNHYTQIVEAYFVPQFTAFHSFLVSGDDRATVYLSTNASFASMAQAAYLMSVVAEHWHPNFPESRGVQQFWLEAGRRYALRVVHHEYGGDDYVKVAARVHNPGFPRAATSAELTHHPVREVQVVRATATVQFMHQQLRVKGVKQTNGGRFYISGYKTTNGVSKYVTAAVYLKDADTAEASLIAAVLVRCPFSPWILPC
jgi:hypothetical protein